MVTTEVGGGYLVLPHRAQEAEALVREVLPYLKAARREVRCSQIAINMTVVKLERVVALIEEPP